MQQDHKQRGRDIQAQLADYTVPRSTWIGRGTSATETLYRAEERRSIAIKDCARAWGKVMDIDVGTGGTPFWNIAVPQALLDTLEAFETAAAAVAAEAFLVQLGYKVERPSGPAGAIEEPARSRAAGP
jgi:hypothetical protein